ncbi:MAG: YraN family protein [Sulfurospirillaceae bacterium]|nr:YraN family protein [Sulfurospirillaceae bacterium]MDD3462180.1 YraN family protein [Sulfurospirillaceae bacterium]
MSVEAGRISEDRACSYLVNQGYIIVERNFFSRFGEIDIIAKKDGVLHFVEVKYSKNSDPILRITPLKMKKIIKTINFYLLKTSFLGNYEIDALLVTPTEIEIIKNISY